MQTKKSNRRKKRRTGKLINLYPNANPEYRELVISLTNAAWNFAHTALWSNHSFEEDDKAVCKDSIKIYFLTHPKKLSTAFIEFCERVMLAKWYVQAAPHRFITHPSHWLNSNNEKGFKGTKVWYEQIEAKRSLLPFHHIGLKTLVVAYLDYILEPSSENFMAGRKSLIALQELSMLQLFNALTIHYHYLSA